MPWNLNTGRSAIAQASGAHGPDGPAFATRESWGAAIMAREPGEVGHRTK
ncbi:MAG TPA: hypothetical protein VNY30_11130 [Bryobacteraceae bacterium]|nr:hypothetical protein [Bryobacteraceae bacterium]